MNYLIYDVETPNKNNDSICACAWMLHDGTKELAFGSQLINPEAPFDLVNISIHNICDNDVCNAPTFAEYWENTLKDLFARATIVAHNAGFDVSVTTKALNGAGLEMPPIQYIDTIAVFRSMLPGESLKLCNIAARYGISYKQHDAGADVRTLSYVLDRLMREKGFESYEAMFKATATPAAPAQPGSTSYRTGGFFKGDAVPEEENRANVEAVLAEARAKNVDFSDIHFSFHGELRNPAINRKGGLDEIVEALGGVYHKAVCQKVDYFVCFDDIVTGTVEKARALAASPGSNMQIIYTNDFLDMLGYRTNDPDRNGPRAIRERKKAERAAAEAAKSKKKKRGAALPDSPVFGGYSHDSVYRAIQRMIGVDEQNVYLKELKSTVAIYMYDSNAFNIILNGKTQCIKTTAKAAMDYANSIRCATVKRDALFVPLSCGEEDRDAVVSMVNAVYASKRDSVSNVEFGCCNDFNLCSDAKRCLKESDPFYLGCQYRKNLEAGRIFYGKNRNI